MVVGFGKLIGKGFQKIEVEEGLRNHEVNKRCSAVLSVRL